MRIYISGKITGTTDYMKRFAEVEERLTKQGHEVVNPAKINAMLPVGVSYDDYMKVCITLLDLCDTIYMMHGWEHSEGAARELSRAREIAKIKFVYYEDSPYSDRVLEKCGAIAEVLHKNELLFVSAFAY